MSLARSFFVNREHNVKFEVRAEFYNVFNRLFLSSPEPVKLSGGGGILVGANPAAPTTRDNQGRRRAAMDMSIGPMAPDRSPAMGKWSHA